MALSSQHTFQVLTKRAERMREYVSNWFERLATREVMIDHPSGRTNFASMVDWSLLPSTLPNVWLGVSTEDQRRADERIPHLLATPSAVRFISAEPLLGPIDLRNHRVCDQCGNSPFKLFSGDPLCPQPMPIHDAFQCPLHWWPSDGCDGVLKSKLDWVIVGGESGSGARLMHPDWARSLRDQCATANVPFFFKQFGEFLPTEISADDFCHPMPAHLGERVVGRDGTFLLHPPGETQRFHVMRRVGKKRAGRLLDGVEHNGRPEVHS
jgi:hypothetical protein